MSGSRARGVSPAPAWRPALEHSWGTAGTQLEHRGLVLPELLRIGCRTELSAGSLWHLSPGFGSSWRKQKRSRETFGCELAGESLYKPTQGPAALGAGAGGERGELLLGRARTGRESSGLGGLWDVAKES